MQFRALSDQLYRSPGYYSELRHAAVEHLRKHPDMYAPYVEGSFEGYCRDMSRDGTWGDHITLQVRNFSELQQALSWQFASTHVTCFGLKQLCFRPICRCLATSVAHTFTRALTLSSSYSAAACFL